MAARFNRPGLTAQVSSLEFHLDSCDVSLELIRNAMEVSKLVYPELRSSFSLDRIFAWLVSRIGSFFSFWNLTRSFENE